MVLADETITEIAGHVSRQMLSRYAHIGTEAKRKAPDERRAARMPPFRPDRRRLDRRWRREPLFNTTQSPGSWRTFAMATMMPPANWLNSFTLSCGGLRRPACGPNVPIILCSPLLWFISFIGSWSRSKPCARPVPREHPMRRPPFWGWRPT